MSCINVCTLDHLGNPASPPPPAFSSPPACLCSITQGMNLPSTLRPITRPVQDCSLWSATHFGIRSHRSAAGWTRPSKTKNPRQRLEGHWTRSRRGGENSLLPFSMNLRLSHSLPAGSWLPIIAPGFFVNGRNLCSFEALSVFVKWEGRRCLNQSHSPPLTTQHSFSLAQRAEDRWMESSKGSLMRNIFAGLPPTPQWWERWQPLYRWFPNCGLGNRLAIGCTSIYFSLLFHFATGKCLPTGLTI